MQAHQRMLDPTANSLHSGESPLLRTVGLTKRYGDFLANDAIDIDIWPTEIHALLDAGITGFFSDFPDLAVRARDEWWAKQ